MLSNIPYGGAAGDCPSVFTQMTPNMISQIQKMG